MCCLCWVSLALQPISKAIVKTHKLTRLFWKQVIKSVNIKCCWNRFTLDNPLFEEIIDLLRSLHTIKCNSSPFPFCIYCITFGYLNYCCKAVSLSSVKTGWFWKDSWVTLLNCLFQRRSKEHKFSNFLSNCVLEMHPPISLVSFYTF